MISYRSTLLKNEQYGDGERQNFDILMPESDSPTPLVIYIHGGSFLRRDKTDAYKFRYQDIDYLLARGITYVTINYSFYKSDDNIGVFRCLEDVKRAIQYLRFNSEKYNIDKERVGVYGVSAGAGSSLYLALNSDFAIDGDKTLLGESTRVTCAGALSTQGTYNLMKWQTYIPGLKLLMSIMGIKFKKTVAGFFGYNTFKEFKKRENELIKKVDFPELIDSDTIPLYIMNLKKQYLPISNDILQHHKSHALLLAAKLKEFGVKHYIYTSKYRKLKEKELNYTVKEFFVDMLRK